MDEVKTALKGEDDKAGHFFASMCSINDVAVDYWWLSTREIDVDNCVGLPIQSMKGNWLKKWLDDGSLKVT